VQFGASRKSGRRSAGIGLLALLMALTAAAQTPTGTVATDTTQTTSGITNARPALTTSLWSKAGVPVVAVRFDGVTFAATDPIVKELEQKAGQPLAPEKVRADLRRLFASGRYRDIEVSSEPNGNGITLIYAGVARYYVGRVEIEGVKQERLASLLEYATQLEPGTIFKSEAMPAAVDAVIFSR